MARIGLQTDGNGATPSGDFPARITVVLPTALDRNLEVYCAKTEVGKSKLIERLLREFLLTQGLDPARIPKSVELTISY
jgi:hypothetical protein